MAQPCTRCGYNEDEESYEDPWRLCPESRSTPCDLCHDLDDLNKEISQTRNLLQDLLNKRRELSSKLNIGHPSIVHRLPVEVTSMIFTLYVNPSDDDDDDNPLTLGAVCRRWRQIAWSTPSVWTTLKIDTSRSFIPCSHSALIKEYLRRSRQLPLSITLCAPFTTSSIPHYYSHSLYSVIEAINQQCNRWHSLDVNLPCSLLSRFNDAASTSSGLHKLSLSSPDDEVVETLRFSRVAPRILDIKGPLSNLESVNFSNATSITMQYASVDHVLDIFRMAPALVECSFAKVAIREELDEHRRVTHVGIRSLKIGFWFNDSMGPFFDHATLPALQRLSLKHSDIDLQVATGSIVSFLRRSSCVVKSLSIRLTNLTDDDLVQITRLTPSLEKLSLVRCPSGPSEFVGFSEALSSHLSPNHPSLTPEPLLPSLQVFKWLGDETFPWRVLPSFFAPLTLGSTSPGRPLTKIQIYCLRLVDGSPIPYIDDDILRQLSKFADKVKFNFGYSTDDGYDGDLWKVSVERGKCPEQGE